MKKQGILEYTLGSLKELLKEKGHKEFNATQIFGWIYKKNIFDFEKMSNLSKNLRNELIHNYRILTTEIINKVISKDGTIKYALKTQDNNIIECVIIFDKKRITLCVSSQVGCPLDCKFCVTGSTGFERNLTCSEIIEQILHSCALGYIPTNIVFMGMGEPLLNIKNVTDALHILFSKEGFNYSPRKITISTSGICDGIEKLEQSFPFLSWAISLHSPDNNLRDSIMPINRKYNLEDLISCLKKIKLKPRKKLTIEYIMLHNINTGINNAKKLVNLLKGIKFKVNLISYNENPYKDFKAPTQNEIEEFQNYLTKKGIVCKLRKSKGQDISAACGQLAKEKKDFNQ